MKDYSRRKLTDLSREEVAEIIKIGEMLPQELSIVGWDKAGEEEGVDFYIPCNDLSHELMREKFVGKCFMNTAQTIILKIIGVSNADQPEEFLYEEFDRDPSSGWELKEYYYYEDQTEPEYQVHGPDHVFLEKNSYAELMLYYPGEDGNLYMERYDDEKYLPLREVDASIFNKIKEEVYEYYRLGY